LRNRAGGEDVEKMVFIRMKSSESALKNKNKKQKKNKKKQKKTKTNKTKKKTKQKKVENEDKKGGRKNYEILLLFRIEESSI